MIEWAKIKNDRIVNVLPAVIISVLIATAMSPNIALAADQNTNNVITSKIATNWTLSKKITPDTVNAKFQVYASGDNYNMALKRVAGMANDFTKYAKRLFSYSDVQTQSGYGSGNQAVIIVKISTKKIGGIPKILGYISRQHYKYKTGIRLDNIAFSASDKLKQAIRSILFRLALKKANNTLKTINKTLGKKYFIKELMVSFGYQQINQERPYNSISTKRLFSATSTGNTIAISKGSIMIKANVQFIAEKRIKKL